MMSSMPNPVASPLIYQDDLLPTVYGERLGEGRIRSTAADFKVDETLSFEPDGEGDHWLLRVEKREANTPWVAGQLARHAGVRSSDVGYAGLKDRYAVTRQWFSVPVATGGDPRSWSLEDARVLEAVRHRRKLRTGSLSGNHFTLVVRELNVAPEALDKRLAAIASAGVPNYFGSQRFGRDGDNVERLLKGKLPRRNPLRGILLSAGRSWLFNEILAQRVNDGSWNTPLPGELMVLDGSRSFFPRDPDDAEIDDRCRRGDIHPSAALWGEGDSQAAETVAELENAVAREYPGILAKLATARMRHDRRPLRMPVSHLRWTHEAQALRLSFSLPAGSFATTVLRELITTKTMGEQDD